MEDENPNRFTTRAEFEARFHECLARSTTTLRIFDPDFAVFPLGSRETDAALRHFLAGGGSIELAMHRTAHIERHYPRFQALVQDYSHRIECRVTGRQLHHLTDSFCIGDDVHIVRRFHSDHMRGEAVFDDPQACEISRERFKAIWLESILGLQSTTTGL